MKGTLQILDETGHTPVAWDTETPVGRLDPAVAEAEFNRLVASGHMAVGTDEAGERVQLKEFDPSYPRIALSPPFAGG